MKVLFSFHRTSGGAPRSQLAHLLLTSESGHEVAATIDPTVSGELLRRHGVRVIYIDNFNLRRPIKNIKTLWRWKKIITEEQPDLLYTNIEEHFNFLSVVSDLYDVPVIPVRPGGVIVPEDMMPNRDKRIIVYSDENKEELIKIGFLPQKIFVIKNRVKKPVIKTRETSSEKNKIVITLVSNIKYVTFNGIKYLLSLFENNRDYIIESFILQIAGQDQSHNFSYGKYLQDRIARLNLLFREVGNFKLLDWVEDIERVYDESDVIIGKGRSIIEPGLLGKVCYVLSENGFITRVRPETVHSLSYYNFSGRGPQADDHFDFLNILKDRTCLKRYKAEAEQVVDFLTRNYEVSHAKERLMIVFQTVISEHKKEEKAKRILRAIIRFSSIYFWAGVWILRRVVQKWQEISEAAAGR